LEAALLEAGLERVGKPGEEPSGVAIGGLERQPDDRRAAITCISCGERTFAIACSRDEQNQRLRSVLVQCLEQALASELVRRRGRDSRRSQFHCCVQYVPR